MPREIVEIPRPGPASFSRIVGRFVGEGHAPYIRQFIGLAAIGLLAIGTEVLCELAGTGIHIKKRILTVTRFSARYSTVHACCGRTGFIPDHGILSASIPMLGVADKPSAPLAGRTKTPESSWIEA